MKLFGKSNRDSEIETPMADPETEADTQDDQALEPADSEQEVTPESSPTPGGEIAENTPGESALAEQNKTDISFSGDLYNFLASRQISLAFTSYQTGVLYILGHGMDRKLSLHQARYPQAMGVVGDGARIYLASHNQIIRLENVLGPDQIANSKFDKVYVPRNFQTTGAVDLHEIGVTSEGKVVFINTKYSCLCELSLKHSFKPIWKPSFISQIVPEDRCHLNGLAMVDGKPKYASAVCRSDVVDGWRDRRHDGGVIIDIETVKRNFLSSWGTRTDPEPFAFNRPTITFICIKMDVGFIKID